MNVSNYIYETIHKMDIGQRIEALREARGWKAIELARRAGLQQPTLHRIEDGTSRDPRRSNIEKIAKALGVSVDVIYGNAPLPLDQVEDIAAAELFQRIKALNPAQQALIENLLDSIAPAD